MWNSFSSSRVWYLKYTPDIILRYAALIDIFMSNYLVGWTNKHFVQSYSSWMFKRQKIIIYLEEREHSSITQCPKDTGTLLRCLTVNITSHTLCKFVCLSASVHWRQWTNVSLLKWANVNVYLSVRFRFYFLWLMNDEVRSDECCITHKPQITWAAFIISSYKSSDKTVRW